MTVTKEPSDTGPVKRYHVLVSQHTNTNETSRLHVFNQFIDEHTRTVIEYISIFVA